MKEMGSLDPGAAVEFSKLETTRLDHLILGDHTQSWVLHRKFGAIRNVGDTKKL